MLLSLVSFEIAAAGNMLFLFLPCFPIEGAHYIELDLVIENCVSNSVHFNVSISHLNNDVS